MPVGTEQCFANVVSSFKGSGEKGKSRGCGALSATCGAVAEIFSIAAVVNGLVPVGPMLLRIEASLEEAE